MCVNQRYINNNGDGWSVLARLPCLSLWRSSNLYASGQSKSAVLLHLRAYWRRAHQVDMKKSLFERYRCSISEALDGKPSPAAFANLKQS